FTKARHLLRACPPTHGANSRDPVAHRCAKHGVVTRREHATASVHPFRDNSQFDIVKRRVLSFLDHIVAKAGIVGTKPGPISKEPDLIKVADIETCLRKPEASVPFLDRDLELHPPGK